LSYAIFVISLLAVLFAATLLYFIFIHGTYCCRSMAELKRSDSYNYIFGKMVSFHAHNTFLKYALPFPIHSIIQSFFADPVIHYQMPKVNSAMSYLKYIQTRKLLTVEIITLELSCVLIEQIRQGLILVLSKPICSQLAD
jgi:hypothetical protein